MNTTKKVKVAWGYPILAGPPPGPESVEARQRRETGNEAWLERLRELTRRAVEALAGEVRPAE